MKIDAGVERVLRMNKNLAASSIMILLAAMITVLFYYPVKSVYNTEYIIVSVCMILYLFFHICLFCRYGWYIFEPITIVGILYFFVFFVDPLLNIVLGTTYCMNEFDVMPGCVKATGAFMIAYIFLILGYYGSWKASPQGYLQKNEIKKNHIIQNWNRKKVEKAALFIWVISFGCASLELVAKGMSISYFLTLGRTGSINDLYNQSAFGFLGNFRFSMITAWVYLFSCNRKSLKTVICGMLTLQYFILRGFRHALFVLIFAPIIYLYIKVRKSPKKSTLIIMLIIAVLVMGIMQFVRGALREDTVLDWTSFEANIFFDAIKGNFDIYKTFYGIAMTVPDQLGYQWGMASIICVITMVIPRYFWPSKPISPLITNLWMFCGELAAKSGYAMPHISEYYLDLGILGCCIGFFVFGRILHNLKRICLNQIYDRHMLILYSIIFPALLQVTLRGYSPGYIFLLLFYSFPVIVIKLFEGIRWKK